MSNIIPFFPASDGACETCPCFEECGTFPLRPDATDAELDEWLRRCDDAAARKGGVRHCAGWGDSA